MPQPQVTLYFDIVSPFAWMGFHILTNSPAFAKCNVTFVPIFLGGLMHACGNTPPIKIKNKDIWINKERLRWARYFSVPVIESTPEGFPPLTLGVQRALTVVSRQVPNKLVPAADALFRAFWVEGNSKIAQPEVFIPILEKVLGKADAQKIAEALSKPETKSLLNANTDQAFSSGAFGLPWFECTNASGQKEGFWGIDHLGQVADFLELDRSADPGFRACL